jgi:phosphoribosyl 1,2-cyclic phosphate phosphodiesterase
VLVDTTPELRLQALAHGVRRIDAVVYTHAHADHVMGLDDVRRFNYVKGGPLDVWADARTHATLARGFHYAWQEPSPDQKVFRPYLVHRRDHGGPFDVAGVRWTPVELLHGDLPVLGFRVGRLAYCTDVSKIPDASYRLLDGLDVLVLDALQRTKHTTHFTLDEAIAEAERIGRSRRGSRTSPTGCRTPGRTPSCRTGCNSRTTGWWWRRGGETVGLPARSPAPARHGGHRIGWQRRPAARYALYMIRRVPLIFAPQPEGGFTVTSPVLPELVTEATRSTRRSQRSRRAGGRAGAVRRGGPAAPPGI